jgi:hypothetical protein
MKAVYLKHRSQHWFTCITAQKAEVFKLGHHFGYGHEAVKDIKIIKDWLFESLCEGGHYELSSEDEFEGAKSQFIRYALSLQTPPDHSEEAKEIFFNRIAQEEEYA